MSFIITDNLSDLRLEGEDDELASVIREDLESYLDMHDVDVPLLLSYAEDEDFDYVSDVLSDAGFLLERA